MMSESKTGSRPAANGDAAAESPRDPPGHPACPLCNARVNRISRRLIDRVISVVHPVHRYRCDSFTCHWEGNLPCNALVRDRPDAMAANSQPRGPASSRAPDRRSSINTNTK
jgi:hypothetical protein